MSTEILNNEQLGTCSVCGDKLTMFGSKTLKNGIICRNCAKLVSEWVTDDEFLKKSILGVKMHLKNRIKNQEKLNSFKQDVVLEGKYSLYIDKEKKAIAVSKKNDIVKSNADIVTSLQIKNVSIKVLPYENTESVDVFFEIDVRGRFFDKISFRVNEFPGMEKNSEGYNDAIMLANEYIDCLIKNEIIKANKNITEKVD